MRNIKKLVSAAMVTMFAFSIAGCNMIAKTPEAIAKSSVAVVNGEKITRGELDKSPAVMQLLAQAKQQYGENYDKNEEAQSAIKTQKEQILDEIITEKVMYQKAKELKLLPDEAKLKTEVDKQISDMKKQQFGNDDKKFQDALKQQNFTEASLKDMYLVGIRNQEISKNLNDYVTKSVKIDDKKIQDYYNTNKYEFTEKPNTIQLAHILVKTEEEAKKVKDRLDKGEDFSKVAKEVSTDPGSKDKGGDLGTVNYVNSGFDQTFMNAALALKEGNISAPVQTQFGYHVIKCIKKQEYPVKKLDAVKEQIRKQLEDKEKNTLFSQKIDEWKKAAKIDKKLKNL